MAMSGFLEDALDVLLIWALLLIPSTQAQPASEPPPAAAACATLVQHTVWTDQATGQLKWDYKIQVRPWRVFGLLTWSFSPAEVQVDAVYAADIVGDAPIDDYWNTKGFGGRALTFELGHQPQADDTFAVSGSGAGASGAPHASRFRCARMAAPAVARRRTARACHRI